MSAMPDPGMMIGAINPPRTELVFATVGAVGTDMNLVCAAVSEALESVGYESKIIKLSQLMHDISVEPWSKLATHGYEDERCKAHMTAGDNLREAMSRGDALALLAVEAIGDRRCKTMGDDQRPKEGCAYVLSSLKHPGEVATLRAVYGAGFFLIGVYSSREKRLKDLATKIADSYHSNRPEDFMVAAQGLNKRDESESLKYGQNVRDTFPLADIFVCATDTARLRASLARYIQMIFSHPYHSPTKDEYAMFHAQAAALRSASMSRQVGAAIANANGDIVSVGTNEVPRAGGGLYWCDGDKDHRDFAQGRDVGARMKQNTLAELLQSLSQQGWLRSNKKITEVMTGLVEGAPGVSTPEWMKGIQLQGVIEFGRCEHAEMAALLDAARRGVPVNGATLYCTTFPCHDCARHIVTAGIRKVVYIQPYPKSLALELHNDAIVLDPPEEMANHVNFMPFVGVAPRRYMDVFDFGDVERKTDEGLAVKWRGAKATPRFHPTPLYYLPTEGQCVILLKKLMSDLYSRKRMRRKGGK